MLGVAAVTLVAGGVGYVALSDPSIVIPDDPCAERPPLREAGVPIPVVQSYRSCAEQRQACRSICGDPQGCPDRCAPPGLSWHQLGAAIDITQEGVDQPAIVTALGDNGWCQSLPGSDPGHFSFDGCH